MKQQYSWSSSIKDFLVTPSDDILNALCKSIYDITYFEAKQIMDVSYASQVRAWKDCIAVLKEQLCDFQHQDSQIILEYVLPRNGGKRPDVLLLLPGELIVLEFKSYQPISNSEKAQLSFYIRNFENYHSAVQDLHLKVRGALVITADNDLNVADAIHRIYLLGRNHLSEFLKRVSKRLDNTLAIECDTFLNGTYQASPSIIESAKAIYKDEPLPQLRAINSTNFNEVIDTITSIIEDAKQSNTHHLVLVSGVPGAGKTYVGLTIAHEVDNAIYLSGNGPLVDVLQDVLHSTTFVQSLYNYKRDYISQHTIPKEQVIIFDEAQRAWDRKKMNGPMSEPDVIIQIAKENKPWSVVIGLIGEGQEIYLGEEEGLPLWNMAIANQQVHVHSRYENTLFSNAYTYTQHDHLHLNSSIRNHAALEYHAFVNLLLNAEVEKAAQIIPHLSEKRYLLHVTDDLAKAKDFVKNTYGEMNLEKTFGVICSSGDDRNKVVTPVPRNKNRYEKPQNSTAFFTHPESDFYCQKLNYSVTEFQAQGLELDMAIVEWSDDFYWYNNQWYCRNVINNATNPAQLKLNAYRVLLTRGRDGTIIYTKDKMLLKLFHEQLNIPLL